MSMDFAVDELYRDIILEHCKSPRNRADLSHISDEDVHENPSCGDSVKLNVVADEDGIKQIQFDGHGCAISTASASLMTELITGKNIEESLAIINLFIGVLRGEKSVDFLAELGDLAIFEGVCKFPMRVKCATLAWHALANIIKRDYLSSSIR